MGWWLHGRTDREDFGQHRRLGHGAAGPVESQGGAESVRAERRSRQGQPAAERGQQLLLAGRRCPHRAGVSRGERGPPGKVQLPATEQDVLRPSWRQGPAEAQVEGPGRVCDARVRRQGPDAEAEGAQGARDSIPQHSKLWRWNPPVEQVRWPVRAGHRRRHDRGGRTDHVPVAAAAGRWPRDVHRPVQVGEDCHVENDPDAGGRRSVQAEAVPDRDDPAEQGCDAGEAKARKGQRATRKARISQHNAAEDHDGGLRAEPLRQGAAQAGRRQSGHAGRARDGSGAGARPHQPVLRGAAGRAQAVAGLVLYRFLHGRALLPGGPGAGESPLHHRHRHRLHLRAGPGMSHPAPDARGRKRQQRRRRPTFRPAVSPEQCRIERSGLAGRYAPVTGRRQILPAVTVGTGLGKRLGFALAGRRHSIEKEFPGLARFARVARQSTWRG
uniref:(northern house mosquito) hypothetical protein n=1 Tax=Culex pipiens TaxID=7175 RepID=A0A8D8F6K7_CULPI